MYEGAMTSFQTEGGATKDFPRTVGFYQGPTLSTSHFTLHGETREETKGRLDIGGKL